MNIDNQNLLIVVLVLGIGLVVTGSFSGLSASDYDIELDTVEKAGTNSFTADTQNRPRGQFSSIAGDTIGEQERNSLDEYNVPSLKSVGVLYEEEGVTRFNGSNWHGSCTVTAGFEEDDKIIEFEVDGDLVSDTRLGCEVDNVGVQEAELTKCTFEAYDSLSQDQSCRNAADGWAYGEYIEVEYNFEDKPIQQPVESDPVESDPYSEEEPESNPDPSPTPEEPIETPSEPESKSVFSLILDILVFWN